MTNVDYMREEQNLENLFDNKSTEESANDLYVKYISERPNSNGLFGNIDCSDIQRVGNELAALTKQGRNIYRGIVSLSGEDAIELGYTDKEKWVQFIRATVPDVAEQFQIPISELQWCAAVHMEKTHPHCHYMFWSCKDRVSSPYIHPSTQDKCRELLSKEMFKAEREQEVINKTLLRDSIVKDTKEFFSNERSDVKKDSTIAGKIDHKTLSQMGENIYNLAAILPKTGRLNYQFLSQEQKHIVDQFVDNKILSNRHLKKELDNYIQSVDNISKTYSASEKHTKVNRDIAIEDIKKRIANCVLKECRDIQKKEADILDIIKQTEVYKESSMDSEPDNNFISDFDSNRLDQDSLEIVDSNSDFKYLYNSQYKSALNLIYDEKNITAAFDLLIKEANNNNVLALLELGKLYERDLIPDVTPEDAQELSYKFYSRAKQGLLALISKDDKSCYHYKLGKLYEKGFGTDIDYEAAKFHYEKAGNYKYAQYSLGSLYLSGNVEVITQSNKKDVFLKGLHYIKQSADNDFGFAAYRYASTMEKEFRDKINDKTLNSYYKDGFQYFTKCLHERKDDFLLYRIGTMYYDGKGVEKDDIKAFQYFKESAELNNALAQYALGKTYADKNSQFYDRDKAIFYLEKSVANNNLYAYIALGNIFSDPSLLDETKALEYYKKAYDNDITAASYKLGKMYADINYTCYNVSLAERYFLEAYSQGEQAAAYQLGKLYCDKNSSLYDAQKGINFLKYAAEKGDAYALGKLGNIYLFGSLPDIPKDIELGKDYLNRAVELGNEFAETSLKIYEDLETQMKYNMYLSAGYSCFNAIFKNLVNDKNYNRELENLKKFRSKSKAAKKAELTKKGIALHPHQ